MPFAEAADSVARGLFDASGAAADARLEAVSLLAERLCREAGDEAGSDAAAAAASLLAAWPASRGDARPMRIQRAFVQRRLRLLAAGRPPLPEGFAARFASLFAAWGAARG